MDMKRKSNLVFWVVITAIILFLAYTLYNRFKPVQEVKLLPGQESAKQGEGTGGDEEAEQGEEAEMAPDFSLKDLEGKEVKLSDFRGKVVVLNFWTTWCKYCRYEMPDLQKVYEEFSKGDDAVILTINVQEDLDTAKQYVKEEKLTLPVLMDMEGLVAGKYGVNGFPMTFVINRDGTGFGFIEGMTNEKTILDAVNSAK